MNPILHKLASRINVTCERPDYVLRTKGGGYRCVRKFFGDLVEKHVFWLFHDHKSLWYDTDPRKMIGLLTDLEIMPEMSLKAAIDLQVSRSGCKVSAVQLRGCRHMPSAHPTDNLSKMQVQIRLSYQSPQQVVSGLKIKVCFESNRRIETCDVDVVVADDVRICHY